MLANLKLALIVGVVGSGMIASSAVAQNYDPAGPVRVGNMCKVITGNHEVGAYGYYAPCGYRAVAEAPARRHYRHRR